MKKKLLSTAVAVGLLMVISSAHGTDWMQWRGPAFNGSSPETNLPAEWTYEGKNIAWKAELPGFAASTPVVCGSSVFLTSPDTNKNLLLIHIDFASGRERWRRTVSSPDREKGRNNMSSPSPVTDGKAVFTMFATGVIAAYDFEGKQKWSRDLAREFGSPAYMWIYGSSPLLHEGKLYIPMLQRSPVPEGYIQAGAGETKRQSFLLCVDPANGANLWRHVRKTDAQNESMEAYTTPIPRTVNGRTEILLFGANHLTAHDPATGVELWRSPDLNPNRLEWWRVVPSPVVAGDSVIVCGPKREPVFAIRPNGKGQLGPESVVWKFKENPSDSPSPLLYKGMLFVLDGDRQVLTRLDQATGGEIWKGNLGTREPFRASPLGADGKIYCVSESGTVIVLEAGQDLKILATITAPRGEAPVRASMISTQGRLLLRTAKHLFCIQKL